MSREWNGEARGAIDDIAIRPSQICWAGDGYPGKGVDLPTRLEVELQYAGVWSIKIPCARQRKEYQVCPKHVMPRKAWWTCVDEDEG